MTVVRGFYCYLFYCQLTSISLLTQTLLIYILVHRENWMIIEGQAFSRSYIWLLSPTPVSKLDQQNAGRLRKRGGGRGGRGAESYERKKAWFSLNHSTLSACYILQSVRTGLDMCQGRHYSSQQRWTTNQIRFVHFKKNTRKSKRCWRDAKS
jgi:hypothetical protein